MRSSVVLPLVAVLALAACKKEGVVAKDESPASVAKKVAASDLKPQPGRWESTMKFEKLEMPGMPEQAREAIGRQMGVTQTFASCLTPEQAAKPDAGFFQKSASDCVYDRFVMAGGKLDAAMTCKRDGRKMTMTMNGSYGDTSYDITVNSEGEMQPGMPMSMAMSIASHRVGACNGSEEK
jgi:hypothetical protein